MTGPLGFEAEKADLSSSQGFQVAGLAWHVLRSLRWVPTLFNQRDLKYGPLVLRMVYTGDAIGVQRLRTKTPY